MGRRGYGGGKRGRWYTCHYTVTTRMTPALSWARMRAILMFHICEGQSPKTVSTDHNFWRERKGKADSNRGPSAYQPNTLLLGQTSSLKTCFWQHAFIAILQIVARGGTCDVEIVHNCLHVAKGVENHLCCDILIMKWYRERERER